MTDRDVVVSVDKADSLMDDELMRADPGSLVLEASCGMYTILKALEKVVHARVTFVGDNLRKRIKPGDAVQTENFSVKHVIQQRKPTLSLEKVKALVAKRSLPEDSVFLVPPIEHREVDLDFLREAVSADELDACYEDSGQTLQLRQTVKGDLKRRLAEVVR